MASLTRRSAAPNEMRSRPASASMHASARSPMPRFGVLSTRRMLTVAGAAAAGLAVWAITRSIGGTELAVRSGGSVREIGPVVVVLTGLLAGLAGWGLLAWFERSTQRPYRAWRLVAVAVFVVSLAGPLGGVGTGARLALAAMHLVVAAVLILGLPAAHR